MKKMVMIVALCATITVADVNAIKTTVEDKNSTKIKKEVIVKDNDLKICSVKIVGQPRVHLVCAAGRAYIEIFEGDTTTLSPDNRICECLCKKNKKKGFLEPKEICKIKLEK